MANKPLNTAILDRAIIFAVRAHTGTERRGKGYPYIVHPMEAVEIVATMTADQELLAAAYLAMFILGAASGAIHPACYAYVGALLPFISAFIYLRTATLLRKFGAATVLNGFIAVLFLIVGEADTAFIVGMVLLTALAELVRHLCRDDARKAIRWSFVPFAFSFFAYTLHWWTDTEGSLAAAREEMPAGYDQLMQPIIDNVPMLVVVLLLTIPVAILAMRLAEKKLTK